MIMKLLNEEPLLLNEYDEQYLLNFYATQYICDESLAIVCETEECEPYATITVNLTDYGVKLTGGEVALNHDLSYELRMLVLNEFAESWTPIKYGMATSQLIHLKQKYIEKIYNNEKG